MKIIVICSILFSIFSRLGIGPMNGDTEVLTHNLLKPAVVVDSFNLHAVISATQHGHVESVEAALKQGLSPNTTDDVSGLKNATVQNSKFTASSNFRS